jgi:hypothetical protein
MLLKKTACLAEDQCGIPQEKQKTKLSEIPSQTVVLQVEVVVN